LKVMSFVQQAGEQRGRIFALNLVYATGILAVFGLLAGLAVGAALGWGEQFTFMSFRLGLTILLFALALSYLGVWEIPAPGFASGEASQKLGNQEGYVGAFFKGMFATLLATPCSGPLLGAILGATINLSPVQTVAIMMTVGIGMALPYLIIGLRPELVSWLPKPGPWMETLKEFLAFLFLGTVAFFFYGFSDEHKVPVFITLIGVWFGCWIIGKVPNWAALQKRVLAWLVGGSAAALIGFAAFAGLRATPPGETLINWQPYSEARLSALQDEGKTVILDFTADWCINCKVNERYALNTEPTRQLLDELDAVAMVADWSDRDNPEIKQKLQELESRSIPVLAIYPGRQPKQPIILRDLVTQSAVLEALQQAGPSRSRPGLAANTSRLHVR
ncbi:MAG: thioredoxin family protein, partial [Planctomycetota bacterium]